MEPKEKKKLTLSVRTVWWLSILLLAVLVVLMVLLLVNYSSGLAAAFVVLMFVFAVLNKGYWKCPSCKKHLGRFGRTRKCPHCGEEWDM